MLADLSLPAVVRRVRTTPEFTAETVPVGLLKAHRIAPGVWGLLRVDEGIVTFVLEATNERRPLNVGDHQVIEPDVPHYVEPGAGARFVIEFYR